MCNLSKDHLSKPIQIIVLERFDARVLIECCSLLECVDVDSPALSIYSSKCFMPMPWTTR